MSEYLRDFGVVLLRELAEPRISLIDDLGLRFCRATSRRRGVPRTRRRRALRRSRENLARFRIEHAPRFFLRLPYDVSPDRYE